MKKEDKKNILRDAFNLKSEIIFNSTDNSQDEIDLIIALDRFLEANDVRSISITATWTGSGCTHNN